MRTGRFGLYVTDGETNATLRLGDTPETITLDRACELLAERRNAEPSTRPRKATKATKKAYEEDRQEDDQEGRREEGDRYRQARGGSPGREVQRRVDRGDALGRLMRRGTFVVFEGIDASGKSTQARRVAELRDAHFTFEPGDTPLGVDLRRWVLDAATPMTPITEALLMLADRSHHVRTVIEPTLASGRSVVSDRYFASTLAYQGYGRGVDLARLEAATELAIGGCLPDMTVLIDTPLDVANERRAPDVRDRFESADLDVSPARARRLPGDRRQVGRTLVRHRRLAQ